MNPRAIAVEARATAASTSASSLDIGAVDHLRHQRERRVAAQGVVHDEHLERCTGRHGACNGAPGASKLIGPGPFGEGEHVVAGRR